MLITFNGWDLCHDTTKAAMSRISISADRIRAVIERDPFSFVLVEHSRHELRHYPTTIGEAADVADQWRNYIDFMEKCHVPLARTSGTNLV